MNSGESVSAIDSLRTPVEIVREFWPDPYEAPANRAHLVEPMA
jgi:hypothetical protein